MGQLQAAELRSAGSVRLPIASTTSTRVRPYNSRHHHVSTSTHPIFLHLELKQNYCSFHALTARTRSPSPQTPVFTQHHRLSSPLGPPNTKHTITMSGSGDPEREHALEQYKGKLLESREWEAKLKSLRLDIKGLQHDFDVSEDNIKALQSVGQIIGEVLKQLDEERCMFEKHYSSWLPTDTPQSLSRHHQDPAMSLDVGPRSTR